MDGGEGGASSGIWHRSPPSAKPEDSEAGFDFNFGVSDTSNTTVWAGRGYGNTETKVTPSALGFKLDITLDSEGDVILDEALDDETIQNGVSVIGPVICSNKFALIKLEITKRRVVNIKRLNEYVHLRNINLSDNRIKDLSPLGFIPHLQVLNVAGNRVSDVSELPNFPYLQALNLARNDISTTMGFQPNRLVWLNLSKNRLSGVDDFTVENFPNLLVLELRGNVLLSLEGLALPKLESLYAAENQLLDLKGIGNCSRLTTLHVRGNNISNLAGLSNLTELKCLNLRDNQISDLNEFEALAGFSNLQTIILLDNPISANEIHYRSNVIAVGPPSLRRLDKYHLTESEQAIGVEGRMRRERLSGNDSTPAPDT